MSELQIAKTSLETIIKVSQSFNSAIAFQFTFVRKIDRTNFCRWLIDRDIQHEVFFNSVKINHGVTTND